MTEMRYATVAFAAPTPVGRICRDCNGAGITGNQYEQPTDTVVLLVDEFCPTCGGCGSGDPEHTNCAPTAHAWAELEDYLPDDEDAEGEEYDVCRSCHGRQWWPCQAVGTDENGEEGLTVLRMPCGCSEDRVQLVTA